MSPRLPVRAKQVAAHVAAALLALGITLLPSLRLAHAASPRTLFAKVERVSDGDTVVALAENGTKLRLRLLGVDAPETPHGDKPGQPFGQESRQYLARLIGGRTIRVETSGPDGFDHILAIVFLGTDNVNVEMVQQGLAEVYRATPCKAYCRDLRVAELRAKRDRVGMWAQGAGYESPAAFRRRMHLTGD